jgi:conjugal transfer pilus assembly protein TraL
MRDLPYPKYLDDPPTLLLWRLDDLMPAVIALVIGILIGHPLVLTLAGFGAGYGYRRYRESRPDGFALHWLYWQGLMPLKARSTPNPFARRFAP